MSLVKIGTISWPLLVENLLLAAHELHVYELLKFVQRPIQYP